MSAIVGQDLPRNDGRRREPVLLLNHRRHIIGDQYFECRLLGGGGEGVRVLAEKQGTFVTRLPAVLADCLRDGRNMQFVERAIGGSTPMPARAEGHPLTRIVHVRVGENSNRGSVGPHRSKRCAERPRRASPELSWDSVCLRRSGVRIGGDGCWSAASACRPAGLAAGHPPLFAQLPAMPSRVVFPASRPARTQAWCTIDYPPSEPSTSVAVRASAVGAVVRRIDPHRRPSSCSLRSPQSDVSWPSARLTIGSLWKAHPFR